MPRSVRPGYVKIAGMKGEEPIEAPPTPPLLTQKPKVDTASTPTQFSTVEHESTSQDGSDLRSTPKPGKYYIYKNVLCIMRNMILQRKYCIFFCVILH